MSKAPLDPPSYEATFADAGSQHSNGVLRSHGHFLHNQITTSRLQHVNDVISIHVLPLVHHRATIGLNQTTLALLPFETTLASTSSDNATTSNWAGDSSDNTERLKVIGIVSDHDDDKSLHQVQLTDPVGSVHFWSQTDVLNECRAALKTQLGSSTELVGGKNEYEDGKDKLSTSPPPPQLQPPQARGFFSRRSSSRSQNKTNTASTAGQTAATKPKTDGITVNVVMDEICLRTESPFGLYQTLTRPAVIVKIVIPSRM